MANAKHQLRDFAAALLEREEGNAAVAAGHVKVAMAAAMNDEGLDVGTERGFPFGDQLTIDATSPGPGLVAVVVDFSIPCGDDAAFFLFRRDDGAWRLLLDREKNDYERVPGAAGSFEFFVSSPDANGAVLVLTTDINPACASMWQSLRWDLFRVGRESESIGSGVEYIYLDAEIKTELTKEGFTLHYTGGSIDLGRVMRSYVRNYRVEKDHLVRVEPFAETALEYVEEWLLMNDYDLPAGEFAVTEQGEDGVWQIELDLYSETAEDQEIPLYFFVAEEKGRFRMVAVTMEPDRESEPAQLPTRER
jgi:hypothetical protein